jgi:hypothetical protein
VAVAAGYRQSLALDSKGSVWAWGGNGEGEVGNSFVSTSRKSACKCIDRPVQVPAIHDAVAIAAGPVTSFALTRTTVPLTPLPTLSPCSRQTAGAVPHRGLPWTVRLDLMPIALAVGERTGHVFLLNPGGGYDPELGDYTCTGSVTTVDLRTGGVLQTVPVGIEPSSMVVAEGLNRVVVINVHDRDLMRGSVSVLDARSGRLLRTTRLDGPAGGGAVAQQIGRIFVPAAPRLFTTDPGAVQMLDATSGARLGTVPIESSVAAVDERLDRVFLASGEDFIALDARSGTILGKLSFAGDAEKRRVCGYPPRLVVNQRIDRLYVVSQVGMCVVDAKTLRLAGLVDLGNNEYVVKAVDERAGVLMVLETQDVPRTTASLVLRAAGDGKLIRSLDLNATSGACGTECGGTTPIPVAVDERTGNIFVGLSNSVNVLSPPGWRTVRRVRVPSGIEGSGLLAVAQRARRLLAVTGSTLTVLCADTSCG